MKKSEAGKRQGREKTRQGVIRFVKEYDRLMAAVFVLILVFGIPALMSIPHAIKEYQLNQLSREVEVLIEEGDFEKAKIKASQIIDDSGWSSESRAKWNSVRESLIDSIDRQEAASLGKIQIGIAYEALKKMDFQEAATYLSKKGFTNITLEPISDLITGWIIKDGEIEEITAGGSDNFTADDYFLPNVKIVISYHTFE